MADATVFDSEIERLGDSLKVMRDVRTAVADALAVTVRTSSLPQDDVIVAEAERLGADADQRRKVEVGLARLVAGIAAGIASEKMVFDRRDVPTGFEAFIGRFSKVEMHRRVRARRQSDAPLRRLFELLRQSDIMVGLLQQERGLLIAARDESEGRLEELIASRTAILSKIEPLDGELQAEDHNAQLFDDFLAVSQALVDGLNDGVIGCNVMLHKLMADTEDMLLLYRILLDPVVRYGEAEPGPERFPHLAGAARRFAGGTLMVHGLDQRRERADQDFSSRFPQRGPSGSSHAETRKAESGWLSSFFGFKFVRS